jgi:hypothetical protein
MFYRLCCGLLVGGLLLAACQSEEDAFDIDLGNIDLAQAQLIDTFTVRTATVQLDSVATSNAPRLLVGRQRDARVGTVRAQAHVEFALGDEFRLTDDDLFDSIQLSLTYDYHFGDTAQAQTLAVHELSRLMDFSETYYNTSTTPLVPAPLAQVRFRSSPTGNKRKLDIRLPDELGRRLYQAAIAGELTTNDNFLELIKGLALVPGPTDEAAILGFRTDSTQLILHYHREGFQDREELTRRFRANLRFNQVGADRQRTPLAALAQPRQSLSANQTGQEVYVQAGTGLGVRIDFPHLPILRNYTRGSLNAAKLVVRTLPGTVEPNTPAPALTLYRINSRNQALSVLPQSFSRDRGQIATYTVDPATGEGRYEFEILQYVDGIIQTQGTEWDGLVLVPVERSHATDRLVLGGNRHPNFRLKLDLFFTVFR